MHHQPYSCTTTCTCSMHNIAFSMSITQHSNNAMNKCRICTSRPTNLDLPTHCTLWFNHCQASPPGLLPSALYNCSKPPQHPNTTMLLPFVLLSITNIHLYVPGAKYQVKLQTQSLSTCLYSRWFCPSTTCCPQQQESMQHPSLFMGVLTCILYPIVQNFFDQFHVLTSEKMDILIKLEIGDIISTQKRKECNDVSLLHLKLGDIFGCFLCMCSVDNQLWGKLFKIPYPLKWSNHSSS